MRQFFFLNEPYTKAEQERVKMFLSETVYIVNVAACPSTDGHETHLKACRKTLYTERVFFSHI